jgi:hypothetical protein
VFLLKTNVSEKNAYPNLQDCIWAQRFNTKNNVSDEIKKGIIAANRSYHGLHKILKSKYITWHSKTCLYKTLIRSVIAYGSEAWVMNKCDENMINIFERKIIRKIFGAVREGDHWRVWYNNEL